MIFQCNCECEIVTVIMLFMSFLLKFIKNGSEIATKLSKTWRLIKKTRDSKSVSEKSYRFARLVEIAINRVTLEAA